MSRAPIQLVKLQDDAGEALFKPLHDITPWQVAMISALFTRLGLDANRAGPMDWRAYLREHQLERHFDFREGDDVTE